MSAAPIILPYRGIFPTIDDTAFVAPGAVVIGDVHIGPESSIWFGCVLRGDVNVIRIGARSNVQDGTIVHVAAEGQGTFVGNDCTVGHSCLLHACTQDESFVGMHASMLDGSRLEKHAMLAAGGLLTGNKTVPSGQLWAGSPAKFWRAMAEKDLAEITKRSAQYVALSKTYR
ncbi:MAG: gamma carbonic anhydrase family protein [Alphaproteobacteria bacterium]|nr:gamma carbonic anhydrase family protein [Alphaproteobacteria bacterium]